MAGWRVAVRAIVQSKIRAGKQYAGKLFQIPDRLTGAAMSIPPKSRRYPRVELPKGMLVAWQHLGIRKVSRVGVLAVGGIFIGTPDPPPVGDVITIFFEVVGGEVRARARVCDSQPG